uniref:Uncharacterized protein n=1 Tax=Nelumbo nucifera TaxID=4432 RepID=A0A822Z5I8_NELNU|nr:TPA_asm: hypothetical protein HUJ06_012961 [Nelumbo nucifera]
MNVKSYCLLNKKQLGSHEAMQDDRFTMMSSGMPSYHSTHMHGEEEGRWQRSDLPQNQSPRRVM